MLVPSTLTGWYKNTMMTSARPIAISKSRVHTRISWRKESSEGDCSEEVLGEIPGELFEFMLDAIGFSSECSILLPYIYNMSIAKRARFRFGVGGLCSNARIASVSMVCRGSAPTGGAQF